MSLVCCLFSQSDKYVYRWTDLNCFFFLIFFLIQKSTSIRLNKIWKPISQHSFSSLWNMKTHAKSYIILYSSNVGKKQEIGLSISTTLSKETMSSYEETLTSERNMTKCVHTQECTGYEFNPPVSYVLIKKAFSYSSALWFLWPCSNQE